MSKELIDDLRYLANRPPYSGAADIMLRAADALEAKAAPVGEREAFEAWCEESGQYIELPVVFEAFQAGATYQRQQSREVVMPDRKDEKNVHGAALMSAIAYNLCLDEFARLNKGAGSHE